MAKKSNTQFKLLNKRMIALFSGFLSSGLCAFSIVRINMSNKECIFSQNKNFYKILFCLSLLVISISAFSLLCLVLSEVFARKDLNNNYLERIGILKDHKTDLKINVEYTNNVIDSTMGESVEGLMDKLEQKIGNFTCSESNLRQ